jgi:hypothetical protein
MAAEYRVRLTRQAVNEIDRLVFDCVQSFMDELLAHTTVANSRVAFLIRRRSAPFAISDRGPFAGVRFRT